MVANERIRPNDSHAQRKSQAFHALACGTTVFLWRQTTHAVFFFNHNAIGERVSAKFVKLKIVSPAAMAKVAIDRASIVFGKKNREIFITNREIGRLSLFYQNRETWKLCNYIIYIYTESESFYSVLLQTQETSAKTYLVAVAEATWKKNIYMNVCM